MADREFIVHDARIVGKFWAKVRPASKNECWLWTDKPDADGYGRLSLKGVVSQARAHRIAAALFLPDYDAALVVRHKCDNPICCNPNHLAMGTQADNIADREARGRGNHEAKRAHLQALADSRRGVPRALWNPGKKSRTTAAQD
jgi:hypothetical protein